MSATTDQETSHPPTDEKAPKLEDRDEGAVPPEGQEPFTREDEHRLTELSERAAAAENARLGLGDEEESAPSSPLTEKESEELRELTAKYAVFLDQGEAALSKGKKEALEVEVYENERYIPLKGWGVSLLPTDRWKWSSKDGKEDRTNTMTDPPPEGFAWVEDSTWGIEHIDGFDFETSQGWSYATDFKLPFYGEKITGVHFVRRRRWFRELCPIQSEGTLNRGLEANNQAAKSVEEVVDEMYENERWFPFKGWGRNMLPNDRWKWSSKDGKVDRSAAMHLQLADQGAEAPPPAGFAWVEGSVWEIEKKSRLFTDPDGWTYAIDFPREFHAVKVSGKHFVRRRRWVRAMRPAQ